MTWRTSSKRLPKPRANTWKSKSTMRHTTTSHRTNRGLTKSDENWKAYLAIKKISDSPSTSLLANSLFLMSTKSGWFFIIIMQYISFSITNGNQKWKCLSARSSLDNFLSIPTNLYFSFQSKIFKDFKNVGDYSARQLRNIFVTFE